MHVVDCVLNFLTVEGLKASSRGVLHSTCGGFYVTRARGTGLNENQTVGLREIQIGGEPSLRTNQNAISESVALQYTRNTRTRRCIYRSVRGRCAVR